LESKTKLFKIKVAKGGLRYFFRIKISWGYISASKLETERAIIFPLSISVQTKAITS